MSSGVDREQKPGVWKSVGFFSSKTRKRSVSTPSKVFSDSFEKANCHSTKPSQNRRLLVPQSTMMAQSQRSRFIKAGAIVSLVLLILVYLSPSTPLADNFGNGKLKKG
jgi:guanosine-diphosphatase